MLIELTNEEIDLVSGGMGNGPSGKSSSTPVDKGKGSTSCSNGVEGGLVAGFLGGLATGNPIGLLGVMFGGGLGGALAGGCFDPPSKTQQVES